MCLFSVVVTAVPPPDPAAFAFPPASNVYESVSTIVTVLCPFRLAALMLLVAVHLQMLL